MFICVSENCPEEPILYFPLVVAMTSLQYIFLFVIRVFLSSMFSDQIVEIQKLLLQSCILFNELDSLQESNEMIDNRF